MSVNQLLVEIGTEELPPKSLKRLAVSFQQELQARLQKAELNFSTIDYFATPRRLALIVKELSAKQADSEVERRGPALQAAFDATGAPTPACAGFAKSCGITPDQLITIKNNQGEWVGYKQQVTGKTVNELLPTLVQESLAALPIPKRMRWGSNTVEFVRPVQSVIMLYGDQIIEADILGLRTGRETRGHRFHSSKLISIKNPETYLEQLEKEGYVIADFERRKKYIKEEVQKALSRQATLSALIPDELLEEVTGLVEWPVIILGTFPKDYLQVPQEALISAMQDHQRYFPVVDASGKLQPYFVGVSNIDSHSKERVIAGNERVLKARLSDAAFFFETDKKFKLEDRIQQLKTVIYQAKLGSLYDKAERISKLTAYIMQSLGQKTDNAERAGLLAKTDLITHLVGEFPELQGIAGYYYALQDKEPEAIALAIKEHYLPRFSGDELPATVLGAALAIADRLDLIAGAFGINQIPTGDKDPFGLRRAALGMLRIIIEKKLDLDVRKLMTYACELYQASLENTQAVEQALTFIQERLKFWYQEQGVNADVYAAVAALGITCPYDIHCRIQAVQAFKKLPEAESLSVANKRVSNILAKYEERIEAKDVNPALFETDAERELAEQLEKPHYTVSTQKYGELLAELAHLRQPVDNFFDKVLVMVDDKSRRENRLLLLSKLRALFLQVADIAYLQMG